jgi:hypothetical protein
MRVGGNELDAFDSATASFLLDIATDLIRDYTGQTITAVAGDSVTVWPFMNRIILLPEQPVTAVTSVTDDGTLADADDYEWTSWGTLSSLYWTGKSVMVVYDHGYATVPDSIKGVCCDVAKRAFENPAGLQRDDLNTASQWLGLTAQNMQALGKYRPL